jgi:hypothetical protein
MYKLYAYNLDGTPINDLPKYSNDSLVGNSPYLVSDVDIPNYTDISSIENWYKYGENVLKDYQEIQKAIRLYHYIKGWDNLTHPEKDIVIKYYANPDLGQGVQIYQIIVHLMTMHGMTQNEAIGYMTECWIEHFERNRECCKSRWIDVVRCVLKYLNFHDASDLDTSLFQLKLAYLDSNLQGIGYGDSLPGIMNFVNSDSIFTGNGLEEKGYVLNTGTIQDFKKELEEVIIDKYFWNDIKPYLV